MASRPSRTAGRKAKPATAFKLTYATMFNPPEELHKKFEAALTEARAGMGQDHAMIIAGRERFSRNKFEDRSPVNHSWLLGTFPKGSAQDVRDAVSAARDAFPKWGGTPWADRVKILRKVAALIEKRVYSIAAVVSMEVGKNRMEALGDVQECADLISYACDQLEAGGGFVRQMGKDPLKGFQGHQLFGAAPVRGVGRDQPVQLPGRSRRRSCGRGAGGGQLRRVQTRLQHALDGTDAGRMLPRRRSA